MRPLCILIICLAVRGLAAVTQADLDYIGLNLEVYVKLTDNLKYADKHLMFITLMNNGRKPINMTGVVMYFYSFFMIEPDFLPNKVGYVSGVNRILLFHVNGMLFGAEFLPNFGIIDPGKSRQIGILAKDWAVSKTDVLNNWYVSAPGFEPRTLISTSDPDLGFVAPFLDANQWKRYPQDVYNPVTPQDRMATIRARDLGRDIVKNRIIPTPLQSFAGTQEVVVSPSWIISAPESLQKEAAYLSGILGLPVANATRDVTPNVIFLEIVKEDARSEEWYSLVTSPKSKNIVITGEENCGVFYGIQTFLSLHDQTKSRLGAGQVSIQPEITVVDSPRYPYRGILLDVARNFLPKETVMRMIDTMAMYKLNKLHLHLSDDEGWRLQIPGVPELTEMASKRCHQLLEKDCLHPQLGSGPFATPPGSGFFTTEDYKAILQHAASRHVEVIPGMSMLTHAHAAIKAMNQRFRATANASLLLVEPADPSRSYSTQMFSDNVMNPCMASTYNFIQTVVSNVKAMHAEAGTPLKVFNFGAEALPPGSWQESSACRTMFPHVKKEDIQTIAKVYFLTRVADILVQEEALVMAAFEDPYFASGAVIPRGSNNTMATTFQTVWEWGLSNRAYILANNGYSVVMSPVTHLSFDHPYEPDPNERGLYWSARFVDTYKAFHLRPDDIYSNIDVKRSGEPLKRTQVCGANNEFCDPLRKPENIKGLQAMLWSELIRNQDHLDYMALPRMLALSERAWHKSAWEDQPSETLGDWEKFVNTVGYNELPRLDEAGLKYRVPPPGANLKDSLVTLQTEFPGLQIQFSRDNGTTWENYTYPIYTTDTSQLHLRSLSADGKRPSRTVMLPIRF